MTTPLLDVDVLKLGPNKVTIVGPTLSSFALPTPDPITPSAPGQLDSVGVTAILTSELVIGVDANYGPIFNPDISNNLDQIVGQATGILGGISPELFAGMRNKLSTRNVQQSALVWRGTEQPSFTLNLLLLALDESDDISSDVQKLYSMVLPQYSSDSGSSNLNSAGTVIAPLGYFPSLQTTAYLNTVSLQLGDTMSGSAWFEAHNLVATSVSFAFSQEIDTTGFPLYAVGTVVLKPARMITFSDFQAYFPG